jgi:hypothetical protein
MTSSTTFTFNLFTVLGPVHAVDPSLSEAQITAAYETLIARGDIPPDPTPPLSKLETLILDVIARLAREQHACRGAGTVIGRTG